MDDATKGALDVLRDYFELNRTVRGTSDRDAKCIVALAALAQPAGEAVAWLCVSSEGSEKDATTSLHARGVYGRMGRTITPLYTAPSVAAGEARDDGLYYLQDTRGYVGNCPQWWRPEGAGYTTRLDEAHRFTLAEAMRQHRSRATDVPWPCSRIDAIQRPTVDMQDMGSIADQVAALTQEQPNG